ncbi:MAG TPA: hypothetical protein ENI95_01105 [Chloroflexi bacterium]|nr:hypothetical protein [Chloroflexota bacterium]
MREWLERARAWLEEKPARADGAALLTLTLLWAFYFWRVLTPNPANQVSLQEGDFSGQFLAFGAYQARRLLAGEIPLWNPYNYAGLPFIADTQAAVFYPPRLVTIFVSQFTGGWGYAALQAEVIAHYWLGALWTYLFVRTITRSRVAGLVSAITLAYGGYLTGYPSLQLAVLEAGIWMPLGLLGVYRASEAADSEPNRWRPEWLALSALALGISLLAGHPQTSLFFTYALAAYVIHRAVRQRLDWRATLPLLVATIGLGFGLAAVQVLPGLEYTRLTIRAGYGFEALAGGFPFPDLIVFLLPNVVTTWSPLYSGIAALALAGVAIRRKEESARFWGIVALVALGLSFGGATILYRLAYLIAPGFSMFRGQERAAYLIAHSLAILAGLGTASLQRQPPQQKTARVIGIGAALAWALAVEVFVADRLLPDVDLFRLAQASFFLAILATLTWALIGRAGRYAQAAWWSIALIGLVVFDLFSVTMGTNWEPTPASERDLLSDLVPVALADRSLFRVDGRLGLGENYGTLVGLQDIRGTSPLRLAALEHYLTGLPQYRLHQLLAVKYVFTDWHELEIPSTIRAESREYGFPIYLHEITDPLPRAWMTYRVMVTPHEEQALGWLADPGFDPRSTVILGAGPELNLPEEPPTDWDVTVERYEPEHITLSVDTPTDGVLVVSEWDYPGWQALVNGEPVPTWRADAGLRALPLRAGTYRIEFVFRPLSVRVGAGISIAAGMMILLVGGILPLYRKLHGRGTRAG